MLCLLPVFAFSGSIAFCLFALISNLLNALALFFIRKRIDAFYAEVLRVVDTTGPVRPASPSVREKVQPILDRLAPLLQLDAATLRLYTDQADYGDAPRMIEAEGHTNIILPLGFTKALRERRDAATAMLAHELGHAAQCDTASWAYATAFSEFIFRWLMPLVVLQALLLIIWAGVAPYKTVTRHETSRQTSIEWNVGLTPGGSPTVVPREKTEVQYETQTTVFPDALDIVRSLVVPFVLAGSYLVIRKGLRASEEMADVAALMTCGSAGLLVALNAPPGSTSSKAAFRFHFAGAEGGWLPIHPTPAWRIKQITRYAVIPVGDLEAALPPPPRASISRPGVLAAHRLRIVGGGIIVALLGFLPLVYTAGNAETAGRWPVVLAVLLWVLGAVIFCYGLARLMQALLMRPRTRTRIGSAMMVAAALWFAAIAALTLLDTSVTSLYRFEWLPPALFLGYGMGLTLFMLGLIWTMIGLLGREFKPRDKI